jgi:transcription elongation factor SPT4
MKGSPDRISVCTTTYYDGVIAVIDPESSWVARWQRICEFRSCLIPGRYLTLSPAKYVPGMYAVRVKGRIPEDVETELESRGIKYRPRDQIDQD